MQRKILAAIDSFKGTLSSRQIGEILKEESEKYSHIDFDFLPIADGGEGTLDAICDFGGFKKIEAVCTGPLFSLISCRYGQKDDEAFIESANVVGLNLIEYKEGNGGITTTFGIGELIKKAAENGAKKIYLSMGGTATNDGGLGCLSALGVKFYDENGREILPIGNSLPLIYDFDYSSLEEYKKIDFHLLTDVTNSLIGERGATRVFGKQKGISGVLADIIEEGMVNYCRLIQEKIGIDLSQVAGAGSAGGLGGALIAFLNAKVHSGIDAVLDMVGFDEKAKDFDILLTGEGKIDGQSLDGKAVSGVCKRGLAESKKIFCIVGKNTLSHEDQTQMGISKIYSLSEIAKSDRKAIEQAEIYLRKTANIFFEELKD